MFPPLDEMYSRLVPVHGIEYDLKRYKKYISRCKCKAALRDVKGSASLNLLRWSYGSIYRVSHILLLFTIAPKV
jgi:hypothetical protein